MTQFDKASMSRRALVSGSIAGMTMMFGAKALARQATPDAMPMASPEAGEGHGDEHDHGDEVQYLAVADPEALSLSVYALPDFTLVDTMSDVAVNAHAGLVALPSGALLFMDDRGKRLIGLEVHEDHFHMHEAAIPGESFSHIAIDSDHAHVAAVGSDDAASPITLVDLETWETTSVPLAEAGEVGVMMNHDVLFHRNDVLNQVEAYLLADVMEGVVEPVSVAPIGPGGHGESITMSGDTLYTATDEGIDAIAWDRAGLTYLTTYSWDSDERSGGRGYFQRLSYDGTMVVSYTADRSAPETEWTTWTNDAVLIDTNNGVTRRIELGNGYVYRFGLAETSALFYRMGGDGDEAIHLDLTTGEIAQRIPLPPMSSGPVEGESIWEANQYRAVTMTPDGSMGFVTQGGDGAVVALDLAAGEVLTTIEVDTALDAGGYLSLFGLEANATDLIAR